MWDTALAIHLSRLGLSSNSCHAPLAFCANVVFVAPKPKKLVAQLSRRGPHRVLRGDLAIAGMPGLVFTPESGLNLPAIAFGHTWMTSPSRYIGTFKHLASWGFVVVAPATERGLVPSALRLAADLNTALDICTSVRLGPGHISVHPSKLGLAGHGFGAGAAVVAAAQRAQNPVKVVAPLYPAPISPSAEKIAADLDIPALILASELKSLTANSRELAAAWKGDVILRLVQKSTIWGILEGRSLLNWFGIGKGDRKTRRTTRALLTGYLLAELAGDKTYSMFTDPLAELKGSVVIDPAAPLPEEEFVDMLTHPSLQQQQQQQQQLQTVSSGSEVPGSVEYRTGHFLHLR